MQTDAEHQQNNAQLRQLWCQFGVGNKPWSKTALPARLLTDIPPEEKYAVY